MSVSLNRFDWIAKYYDTIAGLVYGSALERCQLHFLNFVPSNSRVLILGGGTGKILPPLLHMNLTCQVWYVEASEKMLLLAKKHVQENDVKRVTFIYGTEDSLVGQHFDVIITNFYFDMFSAATLLRICADLDNRLCGGGLWLVSEFINQRKWWQEIMLWVMYRFFILTCEIEAIELPDWQRVLASLGLSERSVSLFYGGFIKSSVFVKP